MTLCACVYVRVRARARCKPSAYSANQIQSSERDRCLPPVPDNSRAVEIAVKNAPYITDRGTRSALSRALVVEKYLLRNVTRALAREHVLIRHARETRARCKIDAAPRPVVSHLTLI